MAETIHCQTFPCQTLITVNLRNFPRYTVCTVVARTVGSSRYVLLYSDEFCPTPQQFHRYHI